MKKLLKHPKYSKRLTKILVYSLCIGLGFAITLSVFRDNIIFFYSPTEINDKRASLEGRIVRIGGLVQEQSVVVLSPGEVTFTVTDLKSSVSVYYKGMLPALFKEGQGVVVLGKLEGYNTFKAIELLAKHDENYIPKEVQKALEKSGQWKPYNKLK